MLSKKAEKDQTSLATGKILKITKQLIDLTWRQTTYWRMQESKQESPQAFHDPWNFSGGVCWKRCRDRNRTGTHALKSECSSTYPCQKPVALTSGNKVWRCTAGQTHYTWVQWCFQPNAKVSMLTWWWMADLFTIFTIWVSLDSLSHLLIST